VTQLVAWVSADRALIGMDTRMTALEPDPTSALGQQLARERAAVGDRIVEGSKLLSLPHARLVLAHMGPGAFLGSVFLACQAQQGGDDFDALDAKLPAILAGAFAVLLEQRRSLFPEVPEAAIRGQLVLLAGWSARRSRVCATVFQQRPQQEGFRRVPMAGFDEAEDPRGRRFAAPWSIEKSGPLPFASTPEVMEQVARAQMRDFGGVAAGRGGRLLVAEVTKDCISVRSQCDLEDESVRSHDSTAPGRPAPPRETGAGHAAVFGRR